MSNPCKHHLTPYERRACVQCGREFGICPTCAKYDPYGRLCEDCEREKRRAAIRRLAENQPDLLTKQKDY